ncbi:hypothetical protein RJ639_031407 [Escallonia herrerae]|uniref:Uncharacterized protein n=1 Tax=Escallonia herrerae TaxID=1293975 RepID=A0AA89BNP7_9ASTE|nr:hypothetical protein RJ639_031407 [Escallonia herrerae]
MVEQAKKQKRGSVSEEDISTILQRYKATTVLALLQEVAHVQDAKIDWNALVKKTTTGITSAREYQMLWRHLAYRDSLLERLDDAAEPLDNDSDLEYELEAFPTVSSEASTEAAACVKVLIASGFPNESSLANGSTVEAPLTINIPNGHLNRVPIENSQLGSFMQGKNITVPVSVQKQPLPAVTSAEGLDAYGSASGNLTARRKRKPWSAAEDMELIAAVQKCGEGNWANILKGDFKGDRTASQLSQVTFLSLLAIDIERETLENLIINLDIKQNPSASLRGHFKKRLKSLKCMEKSPNGKYKISPIYKRAESPPLLIRILLSAFRVLRWAIIRKRQGNLNVGGGSQISEAQLAARRAMSLALNMPMASSIGTVDYFSGTNSNGTASNSARPAVGDASSVGPQQDSVLTVAQRSGTLGSSSKSRVTAKKSSAKSARAPDALVKAAAVAAGARIATPSDAASLLKAAQAKNAVHIMPGGGSLIKSNPMPSPQMGLPPNVHYIRTGLATTPLSVSASGAPNSSWPSVTQQLQGHIARPAVPTSQSHPVSVAAESNGISDATTATSFRINELKVKTAEDIVTSSSAEAPKELVQKDQAAASADSKREQVKEDRAAFLGKAKDVQEAEIACSGNAPKEQAQEDQTSVSGSSLEELIQEDQASALADASIKQDQDNQIALPRLEPNSSKCSSGNDQTIVIDNQVIGEGKNTTNDEVLHLPANDGDNNGSEVMDICENESVNGKQEEVSSMLVDGSEEKVEFLGKVAAETRKDENKVLGSD